MLPPPEKAPPKVDPVEEEFPPKTLEPLLPPPKIPVVPLAVELEPPPNTPDPPKGFLFWLLEEVDVPPRPLRNPPEELAPPKMEDPALDSAGLDAPPKIDPPEEDTAPPNGDAVLEPPPNGEAADDAAPPPKMELPVELEVPPNGEAA